tara:strand:- start:3033 stop:3854 length:822 start_codon:yes stop_codon:yes gene_type:complete
MLTEIAEAAKYIQKYKNNPPTVGIVLGSGLGPFVDEIENQILIPYSDIPHFQPTTVEGHEGRVILGNIENTNIIILQGRLHAYEGLPMEQIVFPIRVMASLGLETIILTNASGGINLDYNQGDLVLINDHINLTGTNPLIGKNINELGPRFPDMTTTYNKDLIEIFHQSAKEINYNLKEGVYCSLLGPTYETPAEIKMLRTLGADMVGMSTVPEVIAARHLNLKIVGLSCIANMAAGISKETLKHKDIKDQVNQVIHLFSQILIRSIKKIDEK